MRAGRALGTATLSGGIASFTTSSLAVGTHSIKVVYSGDTNFKTSTSAVLSQVVQSSADVVVAPGTSQLVDQAIGTLSTDDADADGGLVYDLALEQLSTENPRVRRIELV